MKCEEARHFLHSAFLTRYSALLLAPVAQSPERDASNVEDEGESPSGSANFTGMWFNPNSRGSRLRIWQPWGCKSRVADRRVVNREQQTGSTQDRTALGVQVSPRRPIWNVNRTSEPGGS